jgi:hypothetical protein
VTEKPPYEPIADRLGRCLEAGCTFLDNHTPAWTWLTGWLRCPNGWLARAAFWLYEKGER